MSTSTSQNEDIIVEITAEEKEPEYKDEKKSEDEKNEPIKCLAISPEGDFLVVFVIKNLADLEFELQMYDINKNSDDAGDSTLENNSEQKDDMKPESDSELGNDQELSYRKLFSIPTKFKFTDTQLNLIKDKHENIFMWSVAVSDKSFSSSEFRLLTISFISLEDMKYYQENSDQINHLMEI
ncbi:14888_t:CDS:2, partial [Gigaspora rosea]